MSPSRKVLPISGVLHRDPVRGAGITVHAITKGGVHYSETFWELQFRGNNDLPDPTSSHHSLTEYVAIWLLFIFPPPGFELLGTSQWRSYALFRAGVSAKGDSAKSLYMQSLRVDENLQAARLNLALLTSSQDRALVVELLACAAENARDYNATRYQARYSLASARYDSVGLDEALTDMEELFWDIGAASTRYGLGHPVKNLAIESLNQLRTLRGEMPLPPDAWEKSGYFQRLWTKQLSTRFFPSAYLARGSAKAVVVTPATSNPSGWETVKKWVGSRLVVYGTRMLGTIGTAVTSGSAPSYVLKQNTFWTSCSSSAIWAALKADRLLLFRRSKWTRRKRVATEMKGYIDSLMPIARAMSLGLVMSKDYNQKTALEALEALEAVSKANTHTHVPRVLYNLACAYSLSSTRLHGVGKQARVKLALNSLSMALWLSPGIGGKIREDRSLEDLRTSQAVIDGQPCSVLFELIITSRIKDAPQSMLGELELIGQPFGRLLEARDIKTPVELVLHCVTAANAPNWPTA